MEQDVLSLVCIAIAGLLVLAVPLAIGVAIMRSLGGGRVVERLAQRHPHAAATDERYGRTVLRLTDADEVTIDYLDIRRDRFGVASFTEFRADWPDREFRCEIIGPDANRTARVLPGMTPLAQDGDDRHFIVQSNDADQAQRMLSDNVQTQINALYRNGGPDFYLSIAGGVLVLRKAGQITAMRALRAMAEATLALRGAMLAAATPGVDFVDSASSAIERRDAICEICGEPATENVVYCPRCQTPHHLDCWEYFGACSTYACGEKRFVYSLKPMALGLNPKRIPRPRFRAWSGD